MTDIELKRLEGIAVQLLAGYRANQVYGGFGEQACAAKAIEQAQELIKQLDALKIAE